MDDVLSNDTRDVGTGDIQFDVCPGTLGSIFDLVTLGMMFDLVVLYSA